MTFAKRLQGLRERAGLSQSQLARASGIPVWTLRGYEQGRREPQWDSLIRLATGLGVACEAFADLVTVTPVEEKAKAPRAGSRKPAAPKRPRGRSRKGG
jgi:transcriptional regulator with XRE-family HTH domain